MSLHSDRDVILLNSDTEVYGDWVARLRQAAYAKDHIGTVTPFSNNATICSYPNFAEEFHGLLELPFEELDQLAKHVNAGLMVDLPTAIGFCMYIRRECLDEAGLFDAAAFGQGYGEENDFCLRIAARGWRNVLSGDVFVRHFGRVSFLESTEARVRQALEIVDSRYPHYRKDVQKFIQTDPPRALRRNLDVARLRRVGRAHSVLFVTHDLEGGTPRHVEEMIKHLEREGIGAFMLQPWPGDGRYGLLSHPQARDLGVTVKIDLRHDLPGAVESLREIGVFHIHFHHFMGFTPDAVQLFESLADAAGLTYDFTVHDYLAVCPRVTMIGGNGVYCENHDVAVCEQCIKTDASPFGDVSVRLWRKNYEQFLKGARKIFVPDEDVKLRFTSILPSLQYTVRPHPEPVPEVIEPPTIRKPDEALRVAIIGAIGVHKGSLQLQRCAEDAAARNLPIKFVLFGYSDRPEMLDLPTIESTGPYQEEHLPMLLKRKACHLSLFLSVWPETYSYTLSQAFFSGLYPVAFDIGAIARRIREVGWGLVLPFELLAWPNKINDILLECEVPPMPPITKIQGERRYRSFISDYYGWDPARFGRMAADSTRREPANVG
jgi:GT2 family glycosyltransferase